ncbi:MAG: Crp/Fnr family transcriptional regulator [Clostridiales Family XIII bacterium]|jgi:CRP-like cAMP-binding protein|nr:Crp/Fnr family transcriptional regulator [Clostridiales Family XIII bacterium]
MPKLEETTIDIKKLLHSELFENLTERNVRIILERLPYCIERYEREKMIAAQGSKLYKIGIVLEGSIVASKLYVDGRIIQNSHYGPNDVFGIIIASSRTQILPYMYTAEQDSVILWFDWKTLKEVDFSKIPMTIHNTLLDNIFASIANDAIRTDVKAEVRGQRTVREKILRFLNEMAEKKGSNTFTLDMTQPKFAEYLCVTRPTLNIELVKLREDGIIDYHKKVYTIK